MSSKTVVITGGNAGIGAAAAKKFASQGYSLALLDISESLSELLNEELSQCGVSFQYYQADVTDEAQLERAYAQIVADFGGFDVSVHNAGILGKLHATHECSSAEFEQVMAVNVHGVFYCMKQAINHFLSAQKQGIIINTASVAGHVGMGGYIAYSASKHAVVGMTKTAAVEYSRFGIRINAVCPGFTQTAMLSASEVHPKRMDALRKATPMNRFADPEEIANGIVFLASDQSTFMAGQSLILDGGLTIQ